MPDFNSEKFKNKKIQLQAFCNEPEQQQTRYPVEDPEGVNTSTFPRDLTTVPPSTGAVSLTEIEVMDLISEGQIEGLVSGEYVPIGTLGNLGFESNAFSLWDTPANTTTRWLPSIFWNEVPVVDKSVTPPVYNFQSINIKNTPGYPNGSLIGLLTNELSVSRGIGERLRAGSNFSKRYRILNTNVQAAEINIRVNSLSMTDQTTAEYGDTEETTIQYSIGWRPLFSSNRTPTTLTYQAESIRGKVSYGFIKKTRIDLSGFGTPSMYPDFLGWEIKIERQTPDSINTSIRNQSFIDSLTEIYGDVYTYPNSAIISSRFSAEYFSQVPNRSYDVKLLKVKVPSNYRPISKQYTVDGVRQTTISAATWDGTFKTDKEWTDNPAWCYYDLLTNKRYGLGKYITTNQIDKWSLYEIAKYCDIMVSDGGGGVEPRFSCNTILTSRDDAYEVINNMASIFRAMTYYFGGNIVAVQDVAKSSLFQFTNANVEDGDFNYSSTSKRVRHTVAIVRYNDKNNFYRPAIEYVEDIEGIKRYGVREIELTAYGCTSRGQALRWGRWALFSESLETESISFTAGLEGNYLKPGDIFQVFDANKKTQRLGGRVYQILDSSLIVLDDELFLSTDASLNYTFSLMTPSYAYDPAQVNLTSSSQTTDIRRSHLQSKTITLSNITTSAYDDGKRRSAINITLDPFNTTLYSLTGCPIWLLEGVETTNPQYNQWEYYRALRVEEKDENKFNIAAIQYDADKFALIEDGLNFQEPSYLTVAPDPPTSLTLTFATISENTIRIDYSFTVPTKANVAGYKIFAKKDAWSGANDFLNDTYLVDTLLSTVTAGSIFPTSNGQWYVRVYSISNAQTKSTKFAEGNINIIGINPIRDIVISSLTVTEDTASNASGSRQNVNTTKSDIILKWQASLGANVTTFQDIYYRVTIRAVSNSNTPSPIIYFPVDPADSNYLVHHNELGQLTFNFTFALNNATAKNGNKGPFRTFDAVVEAVLADGTSSAGGNYISDSTKDATYGTTYAKGYDIATVNNDKPAAPVLTEITPPASNPWYTDQWISPDGNINFRRIRDTIPGDVAGGYVYYSTENFSIGEAKGTDGLIPASKTIYTYQIKQTGDPTIIPAQTARLFDINIKNAYMRMSLFDRFDLADLNAGTNIQPKLNMSNQVKLSKRGAFDSPSLIYKAWIKMSKNGSNEFIWQKTSAGIAKVEMNGQDVDIIFDKTFFNNNYVTHYYTENPFDTQGITINQTYANAYGVTQFNDRIRLLNPKFRTNSTKLFIGFLYNSDVNV